VSDYALVIFAVVLLPKLEVEISLIDRSILLGAQGSASEFRPFGLTRPSLLCTPLREQGSGRSLHSINARLRRESKSRSSSFDMNPSPGNIRDGLVTDAMKSAGAAKKGGHLRSPPWDYAEYSTEPGLNLQCTPGNDVECVTAQVAAGASVVLFTTGLGTPTGNPIAPVVKISTNSALAQPMPDIIDIDTGVIILGKATID